MKIRLEKDVELFNEDYQFRSESDVAQVPQKSYNGRVSRQENGEPFLKPRVTCLKMKNGRVEGVEGGGREGGVPLTLRSQPEGGLIRGVRYQLVGPVELVPYNNEGNYGVAITAETLEPVNGWPTGPGVYVYSYPSYLFTPYSLLEGSDDGRTLFKVGYGGRIAKRVDDQAQVTPVAESIELCRAYMTEDAGAAKEAEEEFHQLLKKLGQHHEEGGAGSEWYLTDLSTVDDIAEGLGLEVWKPRKPSRFLRHREELELEEDQFAAFAG